MRPGMRKPCGRTSCIQNTVKLEECVQEWKSYASKLALELQRYQHRPIFFSPLSTTQSTSLEPISFPSIPLQRASGQLLSPSSTFPRTNYPEHTNAEPVLFQNAPLSQPASTLTVIEWAPECYPSLEQPDSPERLDSPERSNEVSDTITVIIRKFTSSIPVGEEQWSKKRKGLGLDDAQGILRAFSDILTPRSHVDTEPSGLPQMADKIYDYLTFRAIEAGEAVAEAERDTALSMFGGLVFMGECCVALKMGVDEEHVDELMKDFLTKLRSSSCQAGPKQLQMYRRVAVWITRQMNLLFENFRCRAFEMFLYAPTPISAYDTLVRSKYKSAFRQSILALKPSVQSPAAFPAEVQAALPFYLPFLVWANFRERLGVDCYEKVCDALETTWFSRDQFEAWYRSLKQKKLEVCAPPIRTSITVQPNKRRKTASSIKGFAANHLTRKRRRTPAQITPISEQEVMSLPIEDCSSTRRSSVDAGEEEASRQARTSEPDDGAGESPSSAVGCRDAAINAQTRPTEIEHSPASSAGERAILGLDKRVPLPAGEHGSTRLHLLLQAAAQQADPMFAGMDSRIDAQGIVGVSEAFVQTGDPDAMLGVPERSIEPDERARSGQNHCDTALGWENVESNMEMVVGVEEVFPFFI